MSSFVCGDNTFNTIYNGLNQYVLENSFISSKVFDELSEGGFVYDNAEDLTNIFYHLNQVAVDSRYNGDFELWDLNPAVLKTKIVEIEPFYKYLSCLTYQCAEDLKIEKYNHAFNALEMIKSFIAEKIAYKQTRTVKGWGD